MCSSDLPPRFGAEVTVVEALGRLLPPEEPEASALLADVFRREGIGVRAGMAATRVAHQGGEGRDAGFTVTLADGENLRAAFLLVATGRRGDLAAIGAATGSAPAPRSAAESKARHLSDQT